MSITNMNSRFIFAAFFVLCCSLNVTAQYDNFWAFGFGVGIDFNTNPPTMVRTSIFTREGSASICDSTGQLLFYTDGSDVWDRQHNIMPNGQDLSAAGGSITNSTTQGTIIIPMPGNAHQYYIFSLGCQECGIYSGKLFYSIVDMTLNNGLGDIRPGIKGVFLDEELTEHMTAVSGDSCNIWLLLSGRTSNILKAYSIGPNGIDTQAVVSTRLPGSPVYSGQLLAGSIDVATDRSKLIMAQGNLVMNDFHPESGTISNPLILDKDASNYYYSVSFSPDNTKLYGGTATRLYQFDLSVNDTNVIIASKTLIAAGLNWPRIKKSPDQTKMYCTQHEPAYYLDVINAPNLPGGLCQYEIDGLEIGSNASLSIPNSVIIVKSRKAFNSSADTAFCVDSFLITALDTSGTEYLWDDGSTIASRMVHQSGTYWISYQVNTPCMLVEQVDTFKVVFDATTRNVFTTTYDSAMCKSDTIFMSATNLSGSEYTWEDGSQGKQRKTNQPGVYWVSYQIDSSLCTQYVDSFIITYPDEVYRVSFSADTLVCLADTIQFQNTSDAPFKAFKWYFGISQDSSYRKSPSYAYLQPGRYDVMLTGAIDSTCRDTVYRSIIVDPPAHPEFILEPNAVCLGTPVYFYLEADSSIVVLQWMRGSQLHIEDEIKSRYQHAFDEVGVLPVTLTLHPRVCPDTSYTDSIIVYPLPEVDLGSDDSLCLHGAPVYLKNLRTVPLGFYHQVWSTGDTTEVLKVVYPGIYTLSVTAEPIGCTTTESIEVTKDCYVDIPNVFTPNGDGNNDYFLPRQVLSKSISRFRMQVFNRWGQLVFETTRLDGRGWDGRFNDIAQPMGVYVYRIDTDFIDGRREHYEGNVTLVR